ncbi:hypothetical protein YWIDRAFT_04815 [Streptomyces sp. SceaMP-e96]|nr:hypothetical protein YWIDRAFT_04815 [Streptomyces sp. SceaMP-e96]
MQPHDRLGDLLHAVRPVPARQQLPPPEPGPPPGGVDMGS